MGLTSSLNIGATALGASQIAIQVTGNNLANAATPGYSRQVALLSPLRPENFGRLSVGTGVKVADVRRQVDEALQSRLWQAIADEAAAAEKTGSLGQLESLLDELGDRSLSNELRGFFNAWSERANLTQSSAIVVQRGQALADFLTKMRTDIAKQADTGNRQLGAIAGKADQILSRIASLNLQVADAEAGGGQANTLRDQRDQLITELSAYMPVTVVEQDNGSVDLLVESTPVVLGGTSRGIEVRTETRGTPPRTTTETRLATRDDGSTLCPKGGRLGAMLETGDGNVADLLATLDQVAQQLIFEVNKLHSTGFNKPAFSTMTGSLSVPGGDRGRSLNDPTNTTLAGLPWKATTGSITVDVTGPTGARQSVRINVDLDGRLANGQPGFADDTSLEDLAASLDAINGLNASITPEGQLKIDGEPGFTFGFSEDTSGALAVLGVNSFYTGTDTRDIAVRSDLLANPNRLTTGRMQGGTFVENGTALGIARLRDQTLGALGGRSIQQTWTDAVQRVGLKADAAKDAADAAAVVRESLQAQRDAVSGVSVDEESINLINYQRVYQGAARFISVVDELTSTLLSIV